jgi:beta-carotene ketolase (CrtW type)
LRDEHWRHHANAGLIHDDPDFHSGNPSFKNWFLSFMLNYLTIGQVCRLLAIVSCLLYLGAPLQNCALFMAIGGISSAVVLFYYGTFIPHGPDEG